MLISNISLSCNEHLEKSTLFKEVFNDGSVNPYQGLLEGPKCQKCAATAINHANTINCGKCNCVYHIPCLITPIDDSICYAVKSNPCLWWVCFHCLSDKTNANVTPVPTDIDSNNIDMKISEQVKINCDTMKSELTELIT